MNPLRWRKMTWLIVVFTLLMGLWIAGGFAANDDVCKDETVNRSACEAGADVGTGVGVTALFCIWLFVFVVLGILWIVTRPTRRICPVCGHEARKGQRVCKKCGFDFSTATNPIAGRS